MASLIAMAMTSHQAAITAGGLVVMVSLFGLAAWVWWRVPPEQGDEGTDEPASEHASEDSDPRPTPAPEDPVEEPLHAPARAAQTSSEPAEEPTAFVAMDEVFAERAPAPSLARPPTPAPEPNIPAPVSSAPVLPAPVLTSPASRLEPDAASFVERAPDVLAEPAPPSPSTPPQGSTDPVSVEGLDTYVAEAIASLEQFEGAIARDQVDLAALAEGPIESWSRNIDIVRLAGAEARDAVLRPILADAKSDPARRTAAALATLLGQGQSVAWFAETSATLDEGGRVALARALELWSDPRGNKLASQQFDAADDEHAARWLDVLRARAQQPDAAMIERALASDEPRLLAAGLRALTREQAKANSVLIERLLFAKDDHVKLAAARAGLMTGHRPAWISLKQLARSSDAPEACELLAALAGARETAALIEWASEPSARPHMVRALGVAGRVKTIEACVALASKGNEASAAAALDAFVVASGYPGEREPAPALAWWEAKRERFEAERRYLSGRPIDLDAILAVMRSGPAQRRRALASELAVRSGNTIHLPPRALPNQQLELFARLEHDPPVLDFEASFAQMRSRAS